MTRRSHPARYLRRCRDGRVRTTAPDRLSAVRVRRFELRLIAVALVVCWSIAAGLVLLAYRPGGPFDLIVGLLAHDPDRDRPGRASIWPPVARGDVAFPVMVWLGILALLCLVPSIAGVVTQLAVVRVADPPAVVRGRLPVADRAPRDEPVQRLRDRPAARGRDGAPPPAARRGASHRASLVTAASASVSFAAVAVANDVALRDTPAGDVALRADRPATSSRRCATRR